ncbi:MAG TPA: class I SAM-dependent methyltransferase [Caulobacteraceae bacterium]|nr:class I SAM-dependent methyltransferase [Caulobacteraceae bacterium]
MSRAHRLDGALQNVAGAFNAAWWSAAAVLARRVAGRHAAPAPQAQAQVSKAAPPPPRFLRESWRDAFAKDARAVGDGLYPPMARSASELAAMVRAGFDVAADAPEVGARRRRGGAREARADAPVGRAYPAYYRQNFHFQSGGWFTPASARRYEAQVETLFAGAAGPMRRCALALLARAWRDRDHRGVRILDLACGAGGFLADLERAFPRARLAGIDLSEAYVRQAARASGAGLAQANAERLPFANGCFDAVTCIYVFHELPPNVRRTVAAEVARVLKPGGLLAFADALQPADEPRLARPLETFPAYFHEPYFPSYLREDLSALFGAAGLEVHASDQAFLTKALLARKTPPAQADTKRSS